MLILARLLARLVGIVLLALVAAAGIVAAVFCLSGGHGTLSLARLASDLHLPQLRGDVDSFLQTTTAHGSVAVLAAVGGGVAIVLGLLLIAGCWVRPRPRRIVLARNEHGSLGSRRRPLASLSADHAAQAPQVAAARARVRVRRRGDGGRLRLRARAAPGTGRRDVRQAARQTLDPWFDQLPVRVVVRGRRARRHDRRLAAQAHSPAAEAHS